MENAPLTPSPPRRPAPAAPWARGRLADEPSDFAFEQAVRLLERLDPERRGPGHFVDPADEAVRFGANASLSFPPAPIHALEPPESPGSPWRMTVNFFGLVGPSGVLPYEYTRLVANRNRARDYGLGAFLDLFQHRAVSLLYRAWRTTRYDVQREMGEADVLGRHLLDLAGSGSPVPSADPDLPPGYLARFAGLLATQPRSAAALEQWVAGIFGVPVEVQPFAGGWFSIREADRTRLDADDDGTRLGLGTVVGDEVWDSHARVRIRLGPVDRETFESFLPSGRRHAVLRALTRFFSRDEYDVELQLVLDGAQVPGVRLGGDPSESAPGAALPDPDGPRLGWSTWLPTTRARPPADDTLLPLTTPAPPPTHQASP